MKNTNVNNKSLFLITNAMMAFSAAMAAYGFCISNVKGSGWVTCVLLAGIIGCKSILTKKAQKISIAAGGAAALVTAAAVIAKVGVMILNIRYAAIVFMAAVAVLSAAQIVLCMMGRTEKEAV